MVPSILDRPPPVSRPTCAKSGVLRAHSVLVSSGRRVAYIRAPAELLSSTQEFAPNLMAVTWSSWQSWNLSGCYGPPGMLSCTPRNIHEHRRAQAGCWAELARVSAGCWASIDRPIGSRPKLGRRPPICRASFARLLLVYYQAPDDLSKGRLPSSVRNVTGLISRIKYARLPGECEIQRLSGDPQIRPETVGYVT